MLIYLQINPSISSSKRDSLTITYFIWLLLFTMTTHPLSPAIAGSDRLSFCYSFILQILIQLVNIFYYGYYG